MAVSCRQNSFHRIGWTFLLLVVALMSFIPQTTAFRPSSSFRRLPGQQGRQHPPPFHVLLQFDKSSSTTSRLVLQDFGGGKAKGEGSHEPDLFDYFDPLLSPHAYPNGISPEAKPQNKNNSNDSKNESPLRGGGSVSGTKLNPFGIDYMSQKQQGDGVERSGMNMDFSSFESNSNSGRDEPDLFDYFDPLRSPHEYPNGISPKTSSLKTSIAELSQDERYNPLQLNTDVISGVLLPDKTSRKKIGVLLMDHGSRNPASNARLHHLAELYQLTMTDASDTATSATNDIVVKAAHMEIATPTIPDGLQALLDEGVDEIICHPYFLSPGRHVMEDIPSIVSQAVSDMSIEIPVITTDPIGSNTQLMIGAIHSSVREHSQILRQQKKM